MCQYMQAMKLIQTIEECCPVVGTEPLGVEDAERVAAAFKALADPTRLRLLNKLAACAEACVCDLVAPTGASQPTVSHHLKILLDAGLVSRRKQGTWAYYRVVPEALETLRAALGR